MSAVEATADGVGRLQQLLLCVFTAERDANSGCAIGNGGGADGRYQQSFGTQPFGELHRLGITACRNSQDWTFEGVEQVCRQLASVCTGDPNQRYSAFIQQASQQPTICVQPALSLRLLLQYLDCSGCGSTDGWRERGGKEATAGTVADPCTEQLTAGYKPALAAECFAERTCSHRDSTGTVRQFADATSPISKYAGGVSFVCHHHSIVSIGNTAQRGKIRNGAVHTEQGVGDNQHLIIMMASPLQRLFQLRESFAVVDQKPGGGGTAAVDQAGVIISLTENGVPGSGECHQCSDIRRETRRENDGRFRLLHGRDGVFQLLHFGGSSGNQRTGPRACLLRRSVGK